ncbi:MAG: SoxR reducing system RseC family protein [Defluviitaleaceae bacterium]|nr:SoxR reducing system RseC family protein [Defluviitaleaceae bacterium]
MGEVGKVIKLEGNTAVVVHQRSAACATCKMCARGESDNEMIMRAENLCGADVGDFVEIELKEGALMKAVGIAYGIPLVAMIAGFAMGYAIAGETAAFVAGIILMGLTYLVIRMMEKNRKATGGYTPVAVRKVDGN